MFPIRSLRKKNKMFAIKIMYSKSYQKYQKQVPDLRKKKIISRVEAFGARTQD